MDGVPAQLEKYGKLIGMITKLKQYLQGPVPQENRVYGRAANAVQMLTARFDFL